MAYNWNIKYPPVRRSKVIPRDVAAPMSTGARPSRQEWERYRKAMLEAVAYEQHLDRMEKLGERIGLVLRYACLALFVWPVQAVIFFFKNIHQIMIFGMFTFFLLVVAMIADLASRIP